MFDVFHKQVVITGASGGLGRELALSLAKKQTSLFLIARKEENLKKVADDCQRLTTLPVYYYAADLIDREQRTEVLKKIKQTMDVDLLINNAGFGYFKTFDQFTSDDIQQMMELNVQAMIHFCKELVPCMQEKERGMIVNVASQAGKIATVKTTIYSASKFAVIGFSNALRLELQPYHIHVMTVNPGPIRTNFFNIAEPSGQYLKALGNELLDVSEVAREVLRGIECQRREVNLPRKMELVGKLYTLFPRIGDWSTSRLFNKK